MKKIALTLVVIIGFISYSYYFKLHKTPQAIISVGQTNVVKKVTVITASPSSPATNVSPTGVATMPLPTEVIPQNTQSPSQDSPYRDGSFEGSVADAVYGNLQVKVTISGGKITNVEFLQYPNDQDTSQQINQQADPQLAQEAIQTQTANVDIISGATQSSQAFIQSMQAALSQAKS